jgi:hypothetical protein
MRKAAKVALLFALGLLSSVFLGVAMALTAAVSLAATALIVPGTGTPNANIVSNYMENARSRYLAPFTPCTSAADCDLLGINYDATFWPIPIGNWCPGLSCPTWNESVGSGVASLHTALTTLPEDAEPFVVFGYSQGGAVVSNELRAIANNPAVLDRIDSVVMIGNAYNPDGGFFTRLGFLGTIPFFDVTFGPPTPVDTGIPMTGIGFEYDPVMYAPLYLGNLLAVVNAVAALQTVHGNYLTPNGNGPTDPIAYGYTDAELAAILATSCPGDFCRVDSFGNEYYMIPAKSLPMFDLVMSFVPGPVQPFVKPIIDLISPVTRVLIDLGYDWSGDPGVARVASFLPFNPVQNWFQVGLDLVEAVGEGIENATGGLTIAPPAPTLSDTPTVAAMSAPAAADPPTNSPAPQALSMASPSTSPESDPVESVDAGAGLTGSTATDTGERTPAETGPIALRSVSEPKTETPSQRRKSGNLFRPGASTADTSAGEGQSGLPGGGLGTTGTGGATTAGQGATGGAGSLADSQDAGNEAA